MKKKLMYLPLLLMALVGTVITGCEKDDEIISSDKLPSSSKSFLSTYYPNVGILYVEKEYDDGKREYEVALNNGHSVTFDKQGDWIDVDAPDGQTIPAGIAPQKIVNYINSDFKGLGINEISRNYRSFIGYEVELVNGVDLNFDSDGNYLGVIGSNHNGDNGNNGNNSGGVTGESELPTAAVSFLSTYYNGIRITYIEKDYEDGQLEYEVYLADGSDVTFNSSGDWLDVDAATGKTIPVGILPTVIATYLANNYAGIGVNEVSRKSRGVVGYEVELINGIEFLFGPEGNFIGRDY